MSHLHVHVRLTYERESFDVTSKQKERHAMLVPSCSQYFAISNYVSSSWETSFCSHFEFASSDARAVATHRLGFLVQVQWVLRVSSFFVAQRHDQRKNLAFSSRQTGWTGLPRGLSRDTTDDYLNQRSHLRLPPSRGSCFFLRTQHAAQKRAAAAEERK